jgi:hypothetical protein
MTSALSSLPSIDYSDRFSLDTDVRATAEQWARAMLGDTPSLGERLIWRVILGLRLSEGRSPGTVAGWRIDGHSDGWIRLATRSTSLSANIVVTTGASRVSVTTMLHYDRLFGRVIWPPLSAVHRLLVPRILRDGDARLRRRAAR